MNTTESKRSGQPPRRSALRISPGPYDAVAVKAVAPITYSQGPPEPLSYFRLFESTGWNEEYRLTPEELFTALCTSWRAVHAYLGTQLVGTGRVISDGVLHALIVDVIVLPSCQGQGVGTEIMRRLLKECRQGDIRDVQLFCATGRAPFYENLGFSARPVEAPGMELDLANVSTAAVRQVTISD